MIDQGKLREAVEAERAAIAEAADGVPWHDAALTAITSRITALDWVLGLLDEAS